MSEYGYLAHHGIKGQKWGVRRYENSDGTLTEEGKKRYSKQRYNKLEKERVGWATAGTIAAVSLIPISLLTAPGTGGSSIPIGLGGGLAIAAVSGAVDKLYDMQLNEIKQKNPGIKRKIDEDHKTNYSDFAKKYERKDGSYKPPKTRQDAIDIIKYDRDKSKKTKSAFGGTFKESGQTHQLIYHYPDKKGKIALSYCKVPGYGNIYVKGNGNINDINLSEHFKRVPDPKKFEN